MPWLMANGNGLEAGIRDAWRQQQLTPGGRESSITGREPSLRGNVPAQKLTIGLDLGDRSSWYCLLDGVGEILLEEKLNTTPKAMKEVFGTMPRCRIALQT